MSALTGAGVELARRGFLEFCKRVDSGFAAPPHIELLCSKLQELHEGCIQRLIVSIPPRHGKSRTCSQLFPAFTLGRDPKSEILIASHSEAVSDDFNRKCMTVIESPEYPFPVRIAQDSRSASRFHVTGGGSCRAVGFESRLLSFGASLLVVDDIANSASEQALAWKWWREIAYPRLNSGGKALLVGARQPGDLIGKILDEDPTWEYLELKALAEEGDILGQPVGAALWESKWPVEELSKIRATMLEAFDSQYQGNPGTGEEPVFELSQFPSFTKLPKPEAPPFDPILWANYNFPLLEARDTGSDYVTILSADCAGIANSAPRSQNSYHALVALCVNVVTGVVYVTACDKLRGPYEDLFTKTLFAISMHSPDIIAIEAESVGSQLAGELKCRRNDVRLVKPKLSKRDRQLEVVEIIRAGQVFIRESIRPHFDPRKRGNEDCIDALVQGLKIAKELSFSGQTISSPVLPPSIFG